MYTKEEQKEHIQHLFIDEIGRLQQQGFYLFSFILMAQAIEVLGSFFDKKPLKARAQSAKRFSKALNILMGEKYRKVNGDHWLYDKLRNQLTHAFVPSKHLLLCSKADKPENAEHLQWHNERLVLVAEEMYSDFKNGCNKMIKRIDKSISN